MDSLLLDEDVLARVFRHLTVQELIEGPLLVCHKWKYVVLFGFHRSIHPPLFQILNTQASETNSPLRRYHMIFERNLLRDSNFECPNFGKVPFKNWWVTKARPWRVTRTANCQSQDHENATDVMDTFNEARDAAKFFFKPANPRVGFAGQLSQVIMLMERLQDASISEKDAAAIMDLSPALQFQCDVCSNPLLFPLEEEIEEGGWTVTIVLDDGTPLLPPYENSTLTAYTRGALHVQEFTFPALPLREETLEITVKEYPFGVRRAVVSCVFHSPFRIMMAKPEMKFCHTA